MHEMALAESMLRIIQAEAQTQAFSEVRSVRLEIGQLSHADPQALSFCFDAVVRGTLAEGAALEITRVLGRALCLSCDKVVALAQRYHPCPECGGHQLEVRAGDEMKVRELVVG